jgi:hypothetical protein
VPKNTNNPFFDQARDGCKKAESESNGAFECLYVGPGEHGGGDEQVQVVADLVAKGVDGIAVSPANAAAMGAALRDAQAAGIPVLTWDSDLLPEDKALRVAYVGTYNYDIGTNIGNASWRSSRRAARSASSPAGRGGQPQRAHAGHSAIPCRRQERRSAGRGSDRPERLDGSGRLPALHQR